MTVALEEGEWSAARPGPTLPLGKPRYSFYRRLGGPQDRSGRAENLVLNGIRFRTVQPVAQSLYRLSYPAHMIIIIIIIIIVINMYQEMANEICAMWKQKAARVKPIVISSMGVIPKSLSQSLTRLNLQPNTYIQIQKSVILGTCSIVRNFLNYR